MDDQTNEEVVEQVDVEEEADEAPEPTDDIDQLKTRLQRLEEKSITQRERTRLLKQELEKARKAAAPKEAPSKQADGLDETQLDYLDLKGVSETEDIKVIERHVKNTGETVRQALKDEYVISKLASNKAKRDVETATPSTTKRAGGQVGDVASAVAKFKETGVLPSDRALADAVVDAVAKPSDDRLPPWQR
jgi:hypothetical protein